MFCSFTALNIYIYIDIHLYLYIFTCIYVYMYICVCMCKRNEVTQWINELFHILTQRLTKCPTKQVLVLLWFYFQRLTVFSFSPQQKLSSSVDRLSRLVQWTSAGRKQLQQDYQCSLEQVDRLTAQLDQGRGLIRELEAQVTRGQDQVTRLKAQLDRSDRQDEQLETLVARQHRSQHGKKLDQQNEVSGNQVQSRTWSCPVSSCVPILVFRKIKETFLTFIQIIYLNYLTYVNSMELYHWTSHVTPAAVSVQHTQRDTLTHTHTGLTISVMWSAQSLINIVWVWSTDSQSAVGSSGAAESSEP